MFQKTVVDQTGSRPPTSDHDVSLVQILLWSFFSVQPLPTLVTGVGKAEGMVIKKALELRRNHFYGWEPGIQQR